MNSNPVETKSLNKHRLHAICPYFAMFPETFARESILSFTQPGDLVFDPFSGRGTTVLEALLNDRDALGCDINPVAAVISQAKADSPKLQVVTQRVNDLENQYLRYDHASLARESAQLPEFYSVAFSKTTLQQVLFLRKQLMAQDSRCDRFICALTLGQLHGESLRSSNFFSNQMPHTIAVKPDYAIRYWAFHKLSPPDRNVFEILRSKALFRLENGTPSRKGTVVRTDARKAMRHFWKHRGQVAAVVTSPPYLDTTNYEEDQWLRLWFLGGKPFPTYSAISNDDRHTSSTKYFDFLADVWQGIEPLLSAEAHIVCRIGAKALSEEQITKLLMISVRKAWPKAMLFNKPEVSALKNRQTDIFRPGSVGCVNEIDYQIKTT